MQNVFRSSKTLLILYNINDYQIVENIINTILQQYGIYGLLIITLAMIIYMIWGDRKNNWGVKIDTIADRVESVGSRLELTESKLANRIENIEQKLVSSHMIAKENENYLTKVQTTNVISKGYGGKLSKVLREYCSKINCDHICMGVFHNGTTDLRGIHYCKFDVLIDEYKNPLKLHPNDTDFQPYYKDENVMAYGDLPYNMTHVDAAVLNVDDPDHTLFELSDTLYRRCKSRDVKQIGFACVRDKEGYIAGFVGCVSYTDSPVNTELFKMCAKEIENIYNN